MGQLSKTQLQDLIDEATPDTYGDEEQVTGSYTLIIDRLALPFQTAVLGVQVSIEDVELSPLGHIVALCSRGACSRGAHRQTIGILDLPLPTPAPEGAEWIEAYRYWAT